MDFPESHVKGRSCSVCVCGCLQVQIASQVEQELQRDEQMQDPPEDDDDDDVIMTEEEVGVKCPYTQQVSTARQGTTILYSNSLSICYRCWVVDNLAIVAYFKRSQPSNMNCRSILLLR